MEQLINRISQETEYSRTQCTSTIDLLLQIGCSPFEIQEIYERNGIEGLMALKNTYNYKLAERSKALSDLITTMVEEIKMKRFLKWICKGRQ